MTPTPLFNEILFGKLQNGGKVDIDESEGKLTFAYSELPTSEIKKLASRVKEPEPT